MSENRSRGMSQIVSNDPLEINLVLQRIRDELDEIQGLRGASGVVLIGSTITENKINANRAVRFIDENGTLIHSIGTTD